MHLDFKEVAGLINLSGVTEIITNKPVKMEKNKWGFYKGCNRLPHFSYEFFVLYFYAEATKDSIENAYAELKKRDKSNIQVVYAPSLRNALYVQELFSKEFAGIRNTNEYLSSFIQDQTRAYLTKLKELEPAHYIEPSYRTPSGFKTKFPNPLLLLLQDSKQQNVKGMVGILVAEAGQGKTYTSQYLVSSLCKDNQIPIYINSKQWVKLTSDDLSSLWKTIAHSFKFYDTPISWIDGNEEEFIRITLKGNIFKLIFDGFDEYILWNHGKINPNETLRSLIELAQLQEATILITSRTSFWDSDISEAEFDSNEAAALYHYKILPFDGNSAKNYFNERFSSDKNKVDRAMHIFGKLKSTDSTNERSSFVGRGIILALIADLVNRTEITPPLLAKKGSLMKWLMKSLCMREQERQQLPISADEQIKVFREFAEHIVSGGVADTEHLRLFLGACVPSLEDKQINQLVNFGEMPERGSLQDHPLIKKNYPGETWEFVHDQILFNLITDQIVSYVESNVEQLQSVISRLNITGSLASDLANTLVDRIYSSYSNEDALSKIQKIIESILNSCNVDFKDLESLQTKFQLLTAISLLTVNIITPKGGDRKERTKQLLNIFPTSKFHRLYFSGTIASFDFSGVAFDECVFDQVTWASCKFSESTKFINCRFLGGRILNCENFGLSDWSKDLFDEKSKAMIYAARIRSGKKIYSIEDLRSDVGSLARKFIAKEGIGFKTISKKYLTSGVIGESKYKDQIIKSFAKKVIESHGLSSISEDAYNVREKAKESLQTFSNNGVFTGELAEVFEELCVKLKIKDGN